MRIGVIGDLHAPFVHPMYLRFCQDVFRHWRVTHVHFVGDIVDLHALSFWDHDPNGMSASDEDTAAASIVKVWHKTFKGATVCIGNHDERHYRVARKAGMPDRYLKSYTEIWNTPTWDWRFSHAMDGVAFEHGTGTSGKDAAINLAIQKRTSIGMGHTHCYAGVKWHANSDDVIFGLNAGCGIDCKAYAFAYGKAFPVRPVLGCGVIVDGEFAHFTPMAIGRGDKYHRSKAGKQKPLKKLIA